MCVARQKKQREFSYIGEQLVEGAVRFHPPQLRLDRVNKTGEELVSVPVELHLLCLHSTQASYRAYCTMFTRKDLTRGRTDAASVGFQKLANPMLVCSSMFLLTAFIYPAALVAATQ